VTKAKKRFAEARTVELLDTGADRLPDVCVHGGEPCPGAPWQGLPYERQLTYKQEQVGEALARIGGLEGYELEEIVPAEEQWRYRNKLEYSFGETDEELALGFHARGRWDLIVDVEDCTSAPPPATRRGTRCASGRGPRRSQPSTAAPSAGSCATSRCARGGGPARCRRVW